MQASNFSFIRNVLDQVKKDMEKNEDPSLRKAFEDLEKQKRDYKVDEQAAKFAEKARAQAEKLGSMAGSTREGAGGVIDFVKDKLGEASKSVNSKIDPETMKPVADAADKVREGWSTVAGAAMNASDKVTGLFENEKKKQFWEEQERARQAGEAPGAAGAAGANGAEAQAQAAQPEVPVESGLVVHHETAWDRFGAKMGDMPFLNSVYDNPLFDRLFGETEIAASIRDMKVSDPKFRLAEFQEEVEDIIAPHVVKSYLEGDADTLKVHCGEAAFTMVHSSIAEREKARVTLDINILAGPRDIELKAAMPQENSLPLFVFTFQTQQINCLRNANGDVVEGDIDDIRTVHYAMVVTKHPDLETPGILYPWQVSELAIMGTTTSW